MITKTRDPAGCQRLEAVTLQRQHFMQASQAGLKLGARHTSSSPSPPFGFFFFAGLDVLGLLVDGPDPLPST